MALTLHKAVSGVSALSNCSHQSPHNSCERRQSVGDTWAVVHSPKHDARRRGQATRPQDRPSLSALRAVKLARDQEITLPAASRCVALSIAVVLRDSTSPRAWGRGHSQYCRTSGLCPSYSGGSVAGALSVMALIGQRSMCCLLMWRGPSLVLLYASLLLGLKGVWAGTAPPGDLHKTETLPS